MSNLDDLSCSTPQANLPVDGFKVPSAHEFSVPVLQEFINQYVSAADIYGEEGGILHTTNDTPLISAAQTAQEEYFSLLGEERFTGLHLRDFIYTRYLVLTGVDQQVDIINYNTPTTITLCDTEGFPYTVTVPLSTQFVDSNTKPITLPLFDKRGTQVYLPLVDGKGKFLLTESVSAIDAKNNIIYFPLKNIKNEYVKYPVRDLSGSIVSVPLSNNSTILTDVTAAKTEFDTLYEFSKDKHGHLFVDYLLDLSESYRLSMFYGDISLEYNTQMQAMPYFIVGVYPLSATDIEVENIESSIMQYYIRYYGDRSLFVIENYLNRDGICKTSNYNVSFNSSATANMSNIGKDTSILSTLNAKYWSITDKANNTNKIVKSAFASQILDMQQSITSLTAAVADLQSRLPGP